MKMTLKLEKRSGHKREIFNYSKKTWWITGFSTNHPNKQASQLIATTTIDFSNHKELWAGFLKGKFAEEKKKINGNWKNLGNYRAEFEWK